MDKTTKLIRKLRRAIGKGQTHYGRGMHTMYFANGVRAHKKAYDNLLKLGDSKMDLKKSYGGIMRYTFTIDRCEVTMFDHDGCNYIDVHTWAWSTPSR